MIRELDDVQRGVWMKAKSGDKKKMLDATDSAGIKAMFENW